MTYTRVTNYTLTGSVLQTLYKNESKLVDLQEQIATGKRVSTVSDDATASANIMNLNSLLDEIDTYISNIDTAITELDTADEMLASVTDLVQQVKELAIEASNSTNGADELKSINDEIVQITENIKSIANTKIGSTYIFAGTNTSTAPYTSPTDGEIDYVGTPSTGDYERNVQIGEDNTLAINMAGDEIFGYYRADVSSSTGYTGTGLFNTLQTLSDALLADPTDYEAISSKLDELDTDLETVISARSKLGSISSRLDMTKTSLEDRSISFESYKSSLEDIDMAEAISELSLQETALEASLSVSAQIMQISLLDYL